MLEIAKNMLDKFPGMLKSARGDGAYDGQNFRKKVHDKKGICIVPPPKDAVYKGVIENGWDKERDDSIAIIEGFGGVDDGRRLWKICSKYYLRSLVETAMFRVKKMFGDNLKARCLGTQKT